MSGRLTQAERERLPVILELAQEQRERLAAYEGAQREIILAAWLTLLSWIEQHIESGTELGALLSVVARLVDSFGVLAAAAIRSAQIRALDQAQSDALDLLRANGSEPTLAGLQEPSVYGVGGTADGLLLRDKLRMGAAALLLLRSEQHWLAGQEGAQLRESLDDLLGRYYTATTSTLRTELQRVYRAVTLDLFSGAGDRWVWIAQLDERTCPVCWAMHGTVHSVDEPFGSHVNCRCKPLPEGDWLADLLTGAELFRRLGPVNQLSVLGRGVFQLFEAGAITLDDLVVVVNDPDVGEYRRRATLAELRALR